MKPDNSANQRILLVDDHKPIHDDFASILTEFRSTTADLDSLESMFFGDAVVPSLVLPHYELDSAFQGQEAYDKTVAAVRRNEPYALSFIDVRMPPGWDGIETIRKLWDVDPFMEFVICTAYADYTWEQLHQIFGDTDRIVFLRKPFDHTEVRQLASSLVEKWNSGLRTRTRTQDLERLVAEHESALESAKREVGTLSGLLPICAKCKKIRNDDGFWDEVEDYFSRHSPAQFSHSICPDCIEKLYPGATG